MIAYFLHVDEFSTLPSRAVYERAAPRAVMKCLAARIRKYAISPGLREVGVNLFFIQNEERLRARLLFDIGER